MKEFNSPFYTGFFGLHRYEIIELSKLSDTSN